MNDKSTYQSPEVIESLDELEVLGTSPGAQTAAVGSAVNVNEI